MVKGKFNMLFTRNIKVEQGFTLVELIVGIALTVLILTATGTVLSSALRWDNDIGIDSAMQQEGKWAVEIMARELRYANTITYPNLNTATLPGNFSYISFTKLNSSNAVETITYGVGSQGGLSAGFSNVLGRNANNTASSVIDPGIAIIANASDLNFAIRNSGNGDMSTEIKITLKLTGAKKKSGSNSLPTATFETTVYKLNDN